VKKGVDCEKKKVIAGDYFITLSTLNKHAEASF